MVLRSLRFPYVSMPYKIFPTRNFCVPFTDPFNEGSLFWKTCVSMITPGTFKICVKQVAVFILRGILGCLEAFCLVGHLWPETCVDIGQSNDLMTSCIFLGSNWPWWTLSLLKSAMAPKDTPWRRVGDFTLMEIEKRCPWKNPRSFRTSSAMWENQLEVFFLFLSWEGLVDPVGAAATDENTLRYNRLIDFIDPHTFGFFFDLPTLSWALFEADETICTDSQTEVCFLFPHGETFGRWRSLGEGFFFGGLPNCSMGSIRCPLETMPTG